MHGYFEREDIRTSAYCGYCKEKVAAIGVELVIGNDPEPSHYICPTCRNKIGGSRLGDFINAMTVVTVVVALGAMMYACVR